MTTQRYDLSRLAATGKPAVGTAEAIEALAAAWDDPVARIHSVVAPGGMGKTTLVNRWLADLQARGFPGADRVFGWTFHGPRSAPAAAATDAFLDHALRWLGAETPDRGSPWERGERLARRVQAQRTLLVLDGVESQVVDDGDGPRFRHPGLAALVKTLARRNPGLCVITGRDDLPPEVPPTGGNPGTELTLSEEAARDLFDALGLGEGKDVEKAARELGGHPFALSLLATYLQADPEGRRNPSRVPGSSSDEPLERMLAAHGQELDEEPALTLLHLLSVFDGPTEWEAVEAVWPPLGNGADLDDAVAHLRMAGLLAPRRDPDSTALDLPASVREFFTDGLDQDAAETARAALFDHFCGIAPEVPESFGDLLRLHASIAHGCRGGRAQDAYDQVYRRRISPEGRYWSTFRLGAFDAEVGTLSAFYEEPFTDPHPGLAPDAHAELFLATGVNLRSVGRLARAAEAFRAALRAAEAGEDHARAADAASSLAEVALARGQLTLEPGPDGDEEAPAIRYARQAVAHADRSRDAFRRITKRAYLADALHQAGRLEESAREFRDAEALQAAWETEFQKLYSLRGYQYVDLLLREPEARLLGVAPRPSRGERAEMRDRLREVRDRVAEIIGWRRDSDTDLDRGLEHLARGRVRLALARTEPEADPSLEREARADLDTAVRYLRDYAAQHRLPYGLLARAALCRVTGDLEAAEADLDEALGLAETTGMVLVQADAQLERARLELARGDRDEARARFEAAKGLVKDHGYHRRDREVASLAAL